MTCVAQLFRICSLVSVLWWSFGGPDFPACMLGSLHVIYISDQKLAGHWEILNSQLTLRQNFIAVRRYFSSFSEFHGSLPVCFLISWIAASVMVTDCMVLGCICFFFFWPLVTSLSPLCCWNLNSAKVALTINDIPGKKQGLTSPCLYLQSSPQDFFVPLGGN